MDNNKVLIEKKEGGVAFLFINNEERRNAISVEVRDALNQALEAVEHDSEVRAIVLSGKGDHFCGGGDIKGWKEMSLLEGKERIKKAQGVLKTLLAIEKPVIAMVKGFAVGAGMNLALACDMVFASEDARFSQSFSRMGLTSDFGGLCILPLVVGLHRAKELLFGAELINAQEAHQMGLVNRVFPKEQIEDKTLAFARQLAEGPPIAYAMTKRILHATYLDKLQQVLEMEAQGQAILFQTKDHREARNAFLSKKSPKFCGE